MLFDTHCHLDVREFDADRDAVIARARAAGVGGQLVPAITRAGWPALRALCAGEPDLHPAYGLHPICLADHRLDDLDALPGWLDGDAVAIGECGLDFYIDGLDPDLQRTYFDRQLELARETGLPLILHARRAVEPVIAALRRVGNLRGVVHSYSGSLEQATQLWKLGFFLGFGGPVTYERATRLRAIVTAMPLEFLLLETDAPDQPLSTHRAQRNEPARLADVAQCIAELRGCSAERIAEATTANARRLFGLDRRDGAAPAP